VRTRIPGLPTRVFNRTALHCALALTALAVGLEPLVVRSLGSRAPTWSHWWCSAASASTSPHTTGGGRLGGALHTMLAGLAVHWPHFLPIALALGTLAYLWRADAQHRSRAPAVRRVQGSVR
jgi:hypothetical protein